MEEILGIVEHELAEMGNLLARTEVDDVVFLKDGMYSHIIRETSYMLVEYTVDNQTKQGLNDEMSSAISRLLEMLTSVFNYSIDRVKDDFNAHIRALPIDDMRQAALQKQRFGLH